MTQYYKKLVQCLRKIAGLLPTALPIGMSEFDAWVDSIVSTYALPGTYRDQKYILSSLIIRLGETTAYKPKYWFVLALRSAAAKQVAGATFSQIRSEVEAERKAQSDTAQKA